MVEYADNTKGQAQRLFQSGDIDNAYAVYQVLSKNTPDDAEVWEMLGAIHGMKGDFASSIECSRKSVELMPGELQSNLNLANALNSIGALEDAYLSYRNVTRIKPDYAAAYHAMGYILLRKEKIQEALQDLDRALQHAPDVAATNYLKGYTLVKLGRTDESLGYVVRAMRADPSSRLYRQLFISALELVRFSSIDSATIKEIENCLDMQDVSHQSIVGAVVSALLLDERFKALLQQACTGDHAALGKGIRQGEWDDVLENSLLSGLLEKAVVCNYDIERMLIALRKVFLDYASSVIASGDSRLSDAGRDFMIRLAHQCFSNEYIFPVGDETAAVGEMAQLLSARLAENCHINDELATLLGVVAMYRPLYGVTGSNKLVSADLAEIPGTLRELLDRQVRQPLEEAEINENIVQLTSISDDPVTEVVRAQYEESPYPRWITTGTRQPQPISQVVASLFPLAEIAPVEIDGNTRILDAGCGTGMNAIGNASLYQGSELTAVDLSRSSLAYATRKAREYHMTNIRFCQADILRLGELNERFHFIESAGVLHHMKDTFGGLKILTDLLQDNGFIRIGLYSRKARQYLQEARDAIKKYNYQADEGGIRDARQTLLEDMTTDYPGGMRWKLARSPDFYSMSNCRDLLFHVHENLFTLPEISEMLDTLHLRFLGFEVKNPQAVQMFRQSYPEDSALQDIGKWDEFEAGYPDTFTGMYIFWCQKQEPGGS